MIRQYIQEWLVEKRSEEYDKVHLDKGTYNILSSQGYARRLLDSPIEVRSSYELSKDGIIYSCKTAPKDGSGVTLYIEKGLLGHGNKTIPVRAVVFDNKKMCDYSVKHPFLDKVENAFVWINLITAFILWLCNAFGVKKAEVFIDARYIIFGLAMAGVSMLFRWMLRKASYGWNHKQVILTLVAGFWRICAVIFPMMVWLMIFVA